MANSAELNVNDNPVTGKVRAAPKRKVDDGATKAGSKYGYLREIHSNHHNKKRRQAEEQEDDDEAKEEAGLLAVPNGWDQWGEWRI